MSQTDQSVAKAEEWETKACILLNFEAHIDTSHYTLSHNSISRLFWRQDLSFSTDAAVKQLIKDNSNDPAIYWPGYNASYICATAHLAWRDAAGTNEHRGIPALEEGQNEEPGSSYSE